MNAQLTTWLVTIRRDEHSTYDQSINARSAWAAGWLYRQLNPGARIIAIRPAHKAPPVAESAAG